jgi:ribokinase
MKIAVVGSASWDLYIETPRLPVEGETLNASGGGYIKPGGKGANTAAACAMAGAKTKWIG